jgi:hypothetical protein
MVPSETFVGGMGTITGRYTTLFLGTAHCIRGMRVSAGRYAAAGAFAPRRGHLDPKPIARGSSDRHRDAVDPDTAAGGPDSNLRIPSQQAFLRMLEPKDH